MVRTTYQSINYKRGYTVSNGLEVPSPPQTPPPEHPGVCYVNTMVPTDELPAYLARYPKGAKYGKASKEGEEWTVADVDAYAVPPDPMLGDVTMVSLGLTPTTPPAK